MIAPDANLIDDHSRVDFAGLEVPFQVPDELQLLVDQAGAYVQAVTGRVYEKVPVMYEPLYLAAVRMRSEQLAFQAQPDYVETASDDVVSSFSVTGYSENRTDPGRRGEQKQLNTWPALNSLLWLLLGLAPGEINADVDSMREYWLALLSGVNAPAFGVSEVWWSAPGYGYGWEHPFGWSWFEPWQSAV